MGPGLKEILFLNNQLTGCIPEGVGMLTDMEVLDLSFNSFTGHLPNSMSCLEEIEVLNFAHNKFSGVLPDLVCSLKSLINLTVSFNFFSGFDQECNKLFYGNVGFDFSGNCIPGRDYQRPQPQCEINPGGINCMRIPLSRPLMCGSSMEFQTKESNTKEQSLKKESKSKHSNAKESNTKQGNTKQSAFHPSSSVSSPPP
ncbi:hypothetical protein MKW94_004007 [Papaver nudicaule]|uniref:Uncharacterized protein n=1 Tax=Papaver nudicaule TaxID=74823 RepID=A0AA41SND0_PAPNU|nr:hypothetical protein [Papaver nudicaule]